MRTIAKDLPRPKKVDAGPAPMLQWIEIEKLRVDDRYQRDLKRSNFAAIGKIATNFRWSRFSPVFVAPIEGGLFAIIDGQHRTHAAAACGMSEVPCQVVQMDLAEQAASFAAVNGLVVKVTLHQIFKAALTSGEEWAVRSDAAVRAAGCEMMTRNFDSAEKKPGQIFAINLIRGLVENKKEAAVTLALSALRRSGLGEEAIGWTNDVLRPWLTAVAARPRLSGREDDLVTLLNDFDYYGAIDETIDFIKAKRRQGVTDISRWDIIGAKVGDAIDRAFPQTMRLPAPVSEARP